MIVTSIIRNLLRIVARFSGPLFSFLSAIMVIQLTEQPVFDTWTFQRQVLMVFSILAGMRILGYFWKRVFN